MKHRGEIASDGKMVSFMKTDWRIQVTLKLVAQQFEICFIDINDGTYVEMPSGAMKYVRVL
jgi:hypothetical protein